MTKTIQNFKNIHAGKTFVCVGSGPSLKDTDWSQIKDKVVIAVNHTYVLFNNSYSVVTDPKRIRELRTNIIEYGNTLFLARCTPNRDVKLYGPPAILVSTLLPTYSFSFDLSKGAHLGYSVIFLAIQLATYMGAAKIHLIGVDQDYGQPQKFFDSNIKRVSTPHISDYELNKPMFEIMYRALTEHRIELVNSTIGGKIDCIPREPLS